MLLELVRAGMLRDDAYAVVQRNAMRAWEEQRPFKELLLADPEVTAKLPPDEIDGLFDPAYHLRNVGVVFERVAALTW